MKHQHSLVSLAANNQCRRLRAAPLKRVPHSETRPRFGPEAVGPRRLWARIVLAIALVLALALAACEPAVPPMVLAFKSNRITHLSSVDDIYIYDTATQSCSTLANAGNPKPANNVDISADGRYVAWDDGSHIKLYDRVQTQMVTLPNCEAGTWPTLSQHAEYIAFVGGDCANPHMALYDRLNAQMLPLPNFPNSTFAGWPCLDPSGQYITYQMRTSANALRFVALYDRKAGAVVPLPGLNDPSRENLWPQVDYGAQTISFWHEGSGNTVSPPVPGEIKVYLRASHTFAPLKLAATRPNVYAWSYDHSLSSNGRYLLVTYYEKNQNAQPPNNFHYDLYLYDRQTDQLLPLANLNTIWDEHKPSISQ